MYYNSNTDKGCTYWQYGVERDGVWVMAVEVTSVFNVVLTFNTSGSWRDVPVWVGNKTRAWALRQSGFCTLVIWNIVKHVTLYNNNKAILCHVWGFTSILVFRRNHGLSVYGRRKPTTLVVLSVTVKTRYRVTTDYIGTLTLSLLKAS